MTADRILIAALIIVGLANLAADMTASTCTTAAQLLLPEGD